jgi:glycosyltransferase involved in cell wall biosynthesis
MRRVAYVCADPGIAVFGSEGASIHVQEMLRALQSLGAQIQLFAANLGGTRPSGLEHVRVHTLSPLPKADAAERERAALRGNAELRWLLEDAGPFDMVYERYSLWSYAGMEMAAAASTAGLLEVSAPLIEEEAEYRVLVDHHAAEQVAQRAFGAAGRVIALSHSIANYLHHRFPETCTQTSVIRSGLDPARFPVRPQPYEPRRAGAFTIGVAGTLQPRHGLQLLLDTFAQVRDTVPGARLLICGDVSEGETLRGAIDEGSLRDVVELTGPVPAEAITELLGRVDVALAARDGRAGVSSSAIGICEYMAAGVPVVASQIPELEELIENGATGLLCAPDDAAAFARALELLAGNPLLRARLGSDARAHVLRHHTWDAAAERVMNLAAVLAAPLPVA